MVQCVSVGGFFYQSAESLVACNLIIDFYWLCFVLSEKFSATNNFNFPQLL